MGRMSGITARVTLGELINRLWHARHGMAVDRFGFVGATKRAHADARQELRALVYALRLIHAAYPDAHRDYHRRQELRRRVERLDYRLFKSH